MSNKQKYKNVKITYRFLRTAWLKYGVYMPGESVVKVSRGQVMKDLHVHVQNSWDLGTD